MSDHHAPTTLINYVQVHESYMKDFERRRIVVQNDCDFTFHQHETRLNGTIECEGDIRIEVNKLLEHLSGNGWRAMVQTKRFSYHAMRHSKDITRYDSASDYRPFPHRHVYDFFGDGRELKTELKYLTNASDVPTLGQMIELMHRWYETNRWRLPLLK